MVHRRSTELSRASAGDPMAELVRAGSALTRATSLSALLASLVDQSVDFTGSEIGAMYLFPDPDSASGQLKLGYRRGRYEIPRRISTTLECVSFVTEFNDVLVLHDSGQEFFGDAFLNERMRSALVAPLATAGRTLGIMVLNALSPDTYDESRLRFTESYVPLAAGILDNTRLLDELREKLRQIEALERYQESIFSSMTNLLVTTDRNGELHYFNRAAQERLGLDEGHIGRSFESVFSTMVDRNIVKAVLRSKDTGDEQLGIEGLIAAPERELDFSLNISPLQGKRGAHEGTTLLFTDQTAERELKGQVDVVREERRMVKDMFARYLSQDLVETLMEHPNSVRLGGDKKLATVFFADIRGYTSFSEGNEPEHIIEVLNAYFSEAVERIISNSGFIDKFIGDAIMAVWGVPLQSEEQDAINAVTCALEIQAKIRAPDRKFFIGDAAKLQVGIGLHTGPLVAGNLGSTQRMDYSVIGDSVNIAARLESIAGGGEVIVTQHTRDMIGERFRVDELEPVLVKGKVDPIPIFRVVEMAG